MNDSRPSRREALKCLSAWSATAVVWTVSGGVPSALGATNTGSIAKSDGSELTFVQISDTHIGFKREANPDVVGSLRRATADIHALAQAPAFVVHTGDVSHVHFIGLTNTLNFKAGTMASLGDEQLAWLKADLAGRAGSTPIVVLAHIPMWTIWEPWGWGTSDSA